MYILHHTSLARGYISRKLDPAHYPTEPYSGRFGTGYVVHSPNWESTAYHYITYYIKQEG